MALDFKGHFAKSDQEAKERYDKYKSNDPFPSIQPALLNSSDIFRYVQKTGMIFPFDPSDNKLKSATYTVKIRGECIYWDEYGAQRSVILDNKPQDKPQHRYKNELLLKSNSIAFVGLEPTFRVPYYLALRFNLVINQVYRGLLLGTGPIVDPGFCGKLYIPLHNFTLNDYILRPGDDLIHMEFTKLSPNELWRAGSDEDVVEWKYSKFPEHKNNKGLNDYIRRALSGAMADSTKIEVRNAIPETIQKVEENNRFVRSIRSWAAGLSIIGIIAVAALIVQLFSLVSDTEATLNAYTRDVIKIEQSLNDLSESVDVLKSVGLMKDAQEASIVNNNEIVRIKKAIEVIGETLRLLESRMPSMQSELEELKQVQNDLEVQLDYLTGR